MRWPLETTSVKISFKAPLYFFPSNVQILMSALVLEPTSVTPMPGVQTLKVLTAAAVSGALKGTAKTVQVKK